MHYTGPYGIQRDPAPPTSGMHGLKVWLLCSATSDFPVLVIWHETLPKCGRRLLAATQIKGGKFTLFGHLPSVSLASYLILLVGAPWLKVGSSSLRFQRRRTAQHSPTRFLSAFCARLWLWRSPASCTEQLRDCRPLQSKTDTDCWITLTTSLFVKASLLLQSLRHGTHVP